MTYTFKLARRLAVLRDYSVLTALALVAACMGDATSPDAEPTSAGIPAAVLQVSPQTVTIETNQRIQFRGQGRSWRGNLIAMPVAWGATGGAISTDGMFSSSVAGTFKVVGRGRGWRHADTSTVVVVPPSTDVVRIAVTPDSASVDTGATRTFTATGYLADGSTTAIGVTWSATGGAIDAGGTYTAGDVGGSYRVIATNTAGTLADTTKVRVNAPAVLASVILKPASVSLIPGETKQFRAYGINSVGDSVAVTVAFTATGGTVSSGGLYTAGQTAGTFRVVANSSGLADTAAVTLAATAPTTTPTTTTGQGIPYGAFDSWDGSSLKPYTESLNLGPSSVTASTILDRIDAARANKVKLILAMTGGSHTNYLSTIDGVYQFDLSKWEARMNTFNTGTIRNAVAAAVADGTIIGNVVMDEPNVSGGGDGNTWGPVGTMTKARVDSLCGYVKAIFPTLPTGVTHAWQQFEPTKSYRVCDFLNTQYSTRFGDVTTWRDGALAMGKRDGHAIMFSLNVLNGGTQDRDGTWDCKDQGGRLGMRSPNCEMTAQQVLDYGLALGPTGCALTMWRYDTDFMSNSANRQSFKDIGAKLATLSGKACRRS